MPKERKKSGKPNHQGDIAHELWAKSGMSGEELAQKLGYSTESTLHTRLFNKEYLDSKRIEQLANIFKVPVDHFFPMLQKQTSKSYKLFERVSEMKEADPEYYVNNIKDCMEELYACIKRELESVKRENDLQARIIRMLDEKDTGTNGNSHIIHPVKV